MIGPSDTILLGKRYVVRVVASSELIKPEIVDQSRS